MASKHPAVARMKRKKLLKRLRSLFGLLLLLAIAGGIYWWVKRPESLQDAASQLASDLVELADVAQEKLKEWRVSEPPPEDPAHELLAAESSEQEAEEEGGGESAEFRPNPASTLTAEEQEASLILRKAMDHHKRTRLLVNNYQNSMRSGNRERAKEQIELAFQEVQAALERYREAKKRLRDLEVTSQWLQRQLRTCLQMLKEIRNWKGKL